MKDLLIFCSEDAKTSAHTDLHPCAQRWGRGGDTKTLFWYAHSLNSWRDGGDNRGWLMLVPFVPAYDIFQK